ncbi:MAG: TSUP family transporter [Acidimicrobiia bacterium]
MTLVAVALGAVIGLTLGALGAGGSILAVPVLVHLVGLPVGTATATSLVAVGAAAAAASLGHRRQVRFDVAGWFVAAGALGALGGAAAGRRLDDDVLLLAFSALVLVAVQRMLTACPSCTRVGEERALAAGAGPSGGPGVAVRTARHTTVTVAAGVAVGFLTGLFGVGGGFVVVPALTLAVGLAMPAAIGTSLVVVAGNAVVALVVRGPTAVDWSTAVAFTVPMLAGSLAGAALARHLDPTRSLRAFAAVLVAVALANAAAVLA